MAAAFVVDKLTPHASLEDRRKAEKSRGLKPGALDRVFFENGDRRDRDALGMALAAFNPITGELDKSKLDAGLMEQLGLIAATNPELVAEVTPLIAGAEELGVDVTPYHEALASLSKPLVPALVASTALTAAKSKSRVEVLDETAPPEIVLPKKILRGFVRGTSTILYGPPGGGKSAATIALGCSVATGSDRLFDNGLPDYCGDVMYVIGEDHRDTHKDRIRAAKQRAGLGWTFKHRIKFFGGDGRSVALFGRKPDGTLGILDDGVALVEELRREPVALLIVDTAAACFHGIDENAGPDVTRAMQFISGLAAEFDLCGVVVHHTNKASGTGASSQIAVRGSNAWIASSRNAIGVGVLPEPEAAKFPLGTVAMTLTRASHDREGVIATVLKIGVNLPATDPRYPTALAITSVLALAPVKPIAPVDLLAGLDTTRLLATLRGGVGGNPKMPWAADQRATDNVIDLLVDRFGAEDTKTAERLRGVLVDKGAITVERRAVGLKGRAKSIVEVAPDAEQRLAMAVPKPATEAENTDGSEVF